LQHNVLEAPFFPCVVYRMLLVTLIFIPKVSLKHDIFLNYYKRISELDLDFLDLYNNNFLDMSGCARLISISNCKPFFYSFFSSRRYSPKFKPCNSHPQFAQLFLIKIYFLFFIHGIWASVSPYLVNFIFSYAALETAPRP
jgi:hypothetical protein